MSFGGIISVDFFIVYAALVKRLKVETICVSLSPDFLSSVQLSDSLDWTDVTNTGHLMRLAQSMYKDVRSRVRVGDGYSEVFGVGVGVHQGSVLSPLLFIIVLEALSREFRTGCPWELLYADDLMISAESMEELLVKVQT